MYRRIWWLLVICTLIVTVVFYKTAAARTVKGTDFALEPVSVRSGSTERNVLKYGEVSTGLIKPKMAKKLAVSDAPHLSRLAGAKVVKGKQSSLPNIVVILSDDQDILAPNYAMPYLRSLPYDHWVTFNHASVSTPVCCPSRSTFLTGQYSHNHKVTGNAQGPALDDTKTVATWLHTAGYNTALFGKYLNKYPFGDMTRPYVPPGWETFFARVNDDDTDTSTDAVFWDSRTKTNQTIKRNMLTDTLIDQAKNYINNQDGSRPFYIEVTPLDPHQPAIPPARYATQFSSLSLPRNPSYNEADVSDKPSFVKAMPLLDAAAQADWNEREKNSWRTSLAVDDGVRSLVETLKTKGQLDNTIFIYTTDNGYSFGEHRWTHKSCAWESCTRVPLYIRYPWGSAANRTDSHLVSNVDFASTFVDIAKTTANRKQNGRSLVPLLKGQSTTWRSDMLLEFLRGGGDTQLPYEWSAVVTTRWKYIEYTNGEKELYDLSVDPDEMVNKITDKTLAPTVKQLKARLTSLKKQ